MKKRVMSCIILVMVLSSFIPNVHAAAILLSGQCGENATYTLDSNGVFTVSGSGDMYDYYLPINIPPWENYKDQIKSAVIEEGITSIGTLTFYFSNLSEIQIPSTVKTIQSRTFQNTPLTSLTLPEGVETIEDLAFIGAYNLNSIMIPRTVTSIGDKAFYGAGYNLTIYYEAGSYAENYFESNTSVPGLAYMLDNGTLKITGEGTTSSLSAFVEENADKIEKLIVEGDIGISNYPFRYCDMLESVELKEGVKYIGRNAFYYCKELKSVTIPSSVESIGTEAFYGCEKLESVKISEGVTSIGSFAFSGCNALKVVNIPSTVVKLGGSPGFFGDSVFSGSSLTEINVAEDNVNYSSVDGVLFSKDKTILYCYPDAKTDSFYEVPDGVQKIENQAFSQRDYLRELIIPNSVTDIGIYALGTDVAMSNENLTDIYYDGTKEEWEAIVEKNVYIPYNALIHFTPPESYLHLSATDNSAITVTAVGCGEVTDGTVVLAIYKNGALEAVQTQPFAETVTFENLSLDGRTVKAMLWDSLGRVMPLAEAGTLTL